jgi:hypothetical protein
MSFDKTMTDGEFATYHATTKPAIKSTKDQLKGELIKEETDISKVNAEISKNNVPLKKSQGTYTHHDNRCNSYNSAADRAARKAKGWFGAYHRKIRDANRSAAKRECGKRNKETPTLNQLKGVDNKLQGEKKTEEQEKQIVDDKIAVNTAKAATLVKQDDYYKNRQEECKRNEQRIKDYESNLTKLKQELDELNTNLDDCNRTYHNKCSIEERNKLSEEIKNREEEMNFLKSKQDEYLTVCNNGPINCQEILDIYNKAIKLHKKHDDDKQYLDEQHKICVDPYRNNCKAKYGELKSSELKLKTQTERIKESFIESMGSYAQHDIIMRDHKKNTDNLPIMQAKVKGFDNGKLTTSASQKKKYDETILTNILLTALASSLLYYTFIEL